MIKLLAAISLAVLAPVASAQDRPEDAAAAFSRTEFEAHRIAGESVIHINEDLTYDQVSVEVTVDEAGTVIDVRPDPDSDRLPASLRNPVRIAAAIAAARQWRFTPFARDGHPVRARSTVSVGFLPAERLPTRHVAFPDAGREDVTITLERTGCFGSCPGYTVTLKGDGSVLFVGQGFVLAEGEHRYSVPVARIDALIAQFRQGDFWSLDDKYEASITDSATYTLSFSAGGQTKTVSDYVGPMVGMPAIVRKLEAAVDEAADTARWIRGDAGTIAALEAEHFDFHSPAAGAMVLDAVEGGPDAVVFGLLDRGAPLDVPARCFGCPGGKTVRGQVLRTAVTKGRLAVFDRLDTGAIFARVDQADLDRLLMAAALARSPHMVQRLLALGANPRATDKEKGSALIQALDDPYDRIAPDADQEAVVRLLIARGAPIEARDEIGWTALQTAYDDDPRLVRLLLAHGARVDAAAKGDQPLLYLTDDEEIALIALQAGADRTLKDSEGHTLPEIARRKRWTRVERLLGTN